MPYERSQLLRVSDAAFSLDADGLIDALRSLGAETGRTDARLSVDDRVELLARMAVFSGEDARAATLAAAGRVTQVSSGQIESWAVPATDHARLCGGAVQTLALQVTANSVCAASLSEARAAARRGEAALLATLDAAQRRDARLPPVAAVALGNAVLLLATDSKRQSLLPGAATPPPCAWAEAAFTASLEAASNAKTHGNGVSELNTKSREAEIQLGTARSQWLWPLIASCPWPMVMITGGYVASEGSAANLAQVVTALVVIMCCIIVGGVAWEWHKEASAWAVARELQLQWLSLLDEACADLPADDDPAQASGATEKKTKMKSGTLQPQPEPELEPQGDEGYGEVDMAEQLARLHEAIQLQTDGETSDRPLSGDGDGSGDSGDSGDSGISGGLSVPLPDDLGPNLQTMLSALEKDGTAETIEQLREHLSWLKEQQERAGKEAATAANI